MSKHIRVKTPLRVYRSEKLQLLDDFCIEVTEDIKYHINHLKREIDIDHYCHDFIQKRLKTF